MRNISVLFAKEFRAYFNTPVAYIFLIVFLALSGWFFTSTLFLVGQASIYGFLGVAPLLFLFFIPAITMRTVAEEERSGTMEILMTLPTREWEIILSKYLSSLALVLVALAFTLIYPISVHFLGNLDWGEVVSSYLALILMGASFCSIGMLASSLTRSQIVAFILGFLVCFVFFILGKVLLFVPTPLVSLVEYLSLDYHFEALSRGVIDSRNLIYYASLCGFALVLTFYSFSRSKFKAVSASMVLTIIGIVIVANYLSYNLFARLDLTQGRIYSLSRGSTDLVDRLEDPVIVKAYITKDLPPPYNAYSKYVTDLLKEYRAQSKGNLRFTRINPSDDETKREAVRAGILPLSFPDVSPDKYGIKQGFMGLLFIYGDRREVIPAIEDISGLEYEVTRQIRRITTEELSKIVFSKGHGELEFTAQSDFVRRLTEDYRVESINIEEAEIPEDAKSLVVAAPRGEFSEQALRRIDHFIGSGGTAAFLLDRVDVDMESFMTRDIRTGLDALLRHYGIRVGEGLVFDRQNQSVAIQTRRGFFTMRNYVAYPLFPLVTNFDRSNPVVKDLESIVLPFVTSLEGGESIAFSSKRSWTSPKIFNASPMQDYEPGEDAEKGPLGLAVVKTGESPGFFDESETRSVRLAVVGTSRFVDPRFGYASNYAFFLNIIDWLTQEESLISIRSKGIGLRPLKPLSDTLKKGIRWVNILLPLVVVFFLGTSRWRSRRRRAYEI
jgi:gliding-associated putative ABC transporter substrate-binding component GldG